MSASCYGVAASDYAWAYNSLSQDPCLVATSLGEACNAAYTIGTIGPGLSYIGPESSVGATACVCSSVLYMMLSACGGCQGSTVFTLWSEYNLNCETIYPMVFPEPIPIEIRVPHWAYANVSGPLGGFNPVDAEEIGDAPETTGVTLPGGGQPTSDPITSSPFILPTSGPIVSGKAKSKSKSHLILPLSIAIPIFVLLCLVRVFIVWNRRRARSKRTNEIKHPPTTQADSYSFTPAVSGPTYPSILPSTSTGSVPAHPSVHGYVHRHDSMLSSSSTERKDILDPADITLPPENYDNSGYGQDPNNALTMKLQQRLVVMQEQVQQSQQLAEQSQMQQSVQRSSQLVHTDSGLRLTEETKHGVEEVPPGYTEA